MDHNTAPRVAKYAANQIAYRFISPSFLYISLRPTISLATDRTPPTQGQFEEDRKWALAMQKAGHQWDATWWQNPRDPTEWPPEDASTAMKQAGARGGQYWAPTAEQLEWEKASEQEHRSAEPSPSAPKHGSKQNSQMATPAPKVRTRRPRAQTPDGSLPIVTPPLSPEPSREGAVSLLSMDHMDLGRSSPIQIYAT